MMFLASFVTTGLLVGQPVSRVAGTRAAICMGPLHDMSATTMDGDVLELSSFAGTPVVAMNVASK